MGSRLVAAKQAGIAADDDSLEQDLKLFVSKGLLVTEDMFRNINGSPINETPVTTVAIPTADRPKELLRCISALIAQCEASAHRPGILVVDSSRHDASFRANRSALVALARKYSAPLQHIGRVEYRYVGQKLAEDGISPICVSHALLSGTRGANRNLIVLLTTGETS